MKILYCLFSLLLVSCTNLPSTKITDEPAINRILVVNTNNSVERYHVAQVAFMETLKGSNINTLNLEKNNHPVDTLQDLLNEQDYDAIYCIGAKALGSIDYIDPDTPVIFSSVLNWRRFSNQPNYYGVASEVAPEAQLTWFKYFFPETKKIGVLYGSDNQALINDAINSADELSMKIVAKEVTSQHHLIERAKELFSTVDALWLISDPTVLASTRDAKQLFESANEHRIPVFSYNSLFIEMGAALSISADMPTTGRQAALLMKNVLGGYVKQAPMQFPAGSSITLNQEKVRVYGMKLNRDALDSVNDILGE